MSMTRTDFEAIARKISEEGAVFTSNSTHAIFAASIAETLSTLAPRFDVARFIAACQPSWTIGTTKSAAWEARIIEAGAR